MTPHLYSISASAKLGKYGNVLGNRRAKRSWNLYPGAQLETPILLFVRVKLELANHPASGLYFYLNLY